MYTKSQIRSWVLEEADATGEAGFDTAPGGVVDRKIGGVHDELWSDILQAARWYRGALRSVTTGSDGTVAKSALSDTADADAQQRLFRVIDVSVDRVPYEEVTDDLPEYLRTWYAQSTAPGTSGIGLLQASRVWWVFDAKLYMLPLLPNQAVLVMVNHRPTRYDQLTADDKLVEFPEGYERILAVRSAAEVIMKGARETSAAIELKASVQDAYNRMLETLARQSTNPTRVRYTDSPLLWGG